MRALMRFVTTFSLALLCPAVADAQDCKVFHNCPPAPAHHAQPPTVVKNVHVPRIRKDPAKRVVVVADFDGMRDASPIRLRSLSTWTDKTTSAEFLKPLAQSIAASRFSRNPSLSSDTSGLFWFGLDVVAASRGEAHYGFPAFAASWDGAIWYFETSANLEAFLADPNKFAPQYGGHCAYCVAIGDFVGGSDSITVYKGKTYLFVGDSYKKSWLANPDSYIAKADSRWPSTPIGSLKPNPLNNLGKELSGFLSE